MDVFALRDRLTDDYATYASSFIQIPDQRIFHEVRQSLNEGVFWPDPLIQLNPSFASGGTVHELTYTAWDLQPFAQDVGYNGAPFIWDDQRRFLMRCELDALYFHLYQINRTDVDYIMETFPIDKRKDIAATAAASSSSPSLRSGEGLGEGIGTYRTKDTILTMYDQMAALPTLHVPAPKDEFATYAVPDVSHWQTWLTPPPADPSVAHPSENK